MSKEYRVKVFKSGNSLAVRLPKALGVAAGAEFDLTKAENGTILIEPVIPENIAFADVFGRFSAEFMADGRCPADEPARDWSVGEGERKVA